MPLTFNAIFLGNSPVSIDPTEGNDVAENAALFANETFGGPGAALAGNWVSFTSVNTGGVANALDMNNAVANDQAIIDSGSGPVTYDFDGTAIYTGTITFIDGTVANPSPPLQFVLAQMTNGDLYIVPRPTAGDPTNAALSAGQIQSISFTSLVGNLYSGMGIDRPVISFVTCFTPGAAIAVPGGTRDVSDLVVGDRVCTRDSGPQPVRWIGRRSLSTGDLRAHPHLRPIVVRAGALGPGLPERDLRVSPQHRLLVSSKPALRMFGTNEVLAAAKHLVDLSGIEVDQSGRPVDSLHIACDRHEVICAEGAPTESLYLGPQTLASLSPEARAELVALFPALKSPRRAAPPAARLIVPGRRARALCRRHSRNLLPLVA